MAKPTAIFNYNINGLVVTFTDLSSNSPTAWLWEFGDGQTVNAQNPVHTYAVDGFFTVTLIATNADGSSTPFSLQIGVSGTAVLPPATILQMVSFYIPAGLTIDPAVQVFLLRKWQLHLSILVEPNIDPLYVYDETKWSTLANMLIAQLVALDLIILGANKYLMEIGNSSTGGREIKKITEGPADVEWFEGSSLWSKVMTPEGAYYQLLQSTCELAKRIRVYIARCGQLSYSPIIPRKYKRHHHHHGLH